MTGENEKKQFWLFFMTWPLIFISIALAVIALGFQFHSPNAQIWVILGVAISAILLATAQWSWLNVNKPLPKSNDSIQNQIDLLHEELGKTKTTLLTVMVGAALTAGVFSFVGKYLIDSKVDSVIDAKVKELVDNKVGEEMGSIKRSIGDTIQSRLYLMRDTLLLPSGIRNARSIRVDNVCLDGVTLTRQDGMKTIGKIKAGSTTLNINGGFDTLYVLKRK